MERYFFANFLIIDMQSRAVYHTSLKELIHFGLMPKPYLKSIPRSNVHRWKHDDFKRYKGSEINNIADNHAELIQTLNEWPKMFKAYGKLVKTFMSIAQRTNDFPSVLRDHKHNVVKAINSTKKLISIDKAVKVFGISAGTFYTWVIDTQLSCSKSYFKKCNRVYSNQVTPTEVKTIKQALRNPKTLHWSIQSVYDKGFRSGEITTSLNTVYKINKVLGI